MRQSQSTFNVDWTRVEHVDWPLVFDTDPYQIDTFNFDKIICRWFKRVSLLNVSFMLTTNSKVGIKNDLMHFTKNAKI